MAQLHYARLRRCVPPVPNKHDGEFVCGGTATYIQMEEVNAARSCLCADRRLQEALAALDWEERAKTHLSLRKVVHGLRWCECACSSQLRVGMPAIRGYPGRRGFDARCRLGKMHFGSYPRPQSRPQARWRAPARGRSRRRRRSRCVCVLLCVYVGVCMLVS